MKIARVAGHVVATVRAKGMQSDKLSLVEFIGKDGKPTGDVSVAIDQLGAGVDEWVLLVTGSSARSAYSDDKSARKALDLCIVGIIDEVVARENTWYLK